MSDRDIQRWSREVAEDPGAPSFVRLARAYRKQGRREAARELVEQGLATNPENLAAHSLLALIHLEEGDRERAQDEWETVLRLDPRSFDGLRGLGFLALERDDLSAARRHLDAAAGVRPDDPAVAEARRLIERRAAAPLRAADAEPAAPAPEAMRPGPVPAPARPAPTAAGPDEARQGSRGDPGGLFDPLEEEGMFMGALVLDGQGRPLAGGFPPEQGGTGELLGALLNGVAEEAERTTDLLGIGKWERLLIEGDGAILHASSLPVGGMLLTAARPGTPAGWVVRLSGRARALAQRFLDGGP